MRRPSDVEEFYGLLHALEVRIGGRRRLGECHGRMGWPERGVYFFYEPGEFRSIDRSSPRVTRIGTHALIENSRTSLWNRLSQHRGTINPRRGNHRGSIFRLLVGKALMNRDHTLAVRTWGQKSSAPPEVRLAERSMEALVSDYIGNMTLVFLDVPDDPGSQSARGVIERNAIALLSGFLSPSPDRPSASWLGQFSDRDRVRRSGLWNNNHVEETYEPEFLEIFRTLVQQAPPT